MEAYDQCGNLQCGNLVPYGDYLCQQCKTGKQPTTAKQCTENPRKRDGLVIPEQYLAKHWNLSQSCTIEQNR